MTLPYSPNIHKHVHNDKPVITKLVINNNIPLSTNIPVSNKTPVNNSTPVCTNTLEGFMIKFTS